MWLSYDTVSKYRLTCILVCLSSYRITAQDYTVYLQKNCHGFPLLPYPTTSLSIQECRAECLSRECCVAFTYSQQTGICYPKAQCDPPLRGSTITEVHIRNIDMNSCGAHHAADGRCDAVYALQENVVLHENLVHCPWACLAEREYTVADEESCSVMCLGAPLCVNFHYDNSQRRCTINSNKKSNVYSLLI